MRTAALRVSQSNWMSATRNRFTRRSPRSKRKFGHIDILVNNAGINRPTPVCRWTSRIGTIISIRMYVEAFSALRL